MSKAVGIPSRENHGNTSDIPVNQLLTYIDQLHKARRAGKHHDIRFGDKELFSWATRKGLPEPGQKRMLFQQPIHSKEYADFEGEIPEGYGAGVVSKSEKGTVLVTEATDNKIKFVLAHKKYPEYYTMIRQQGANKPWLMINHTPTSPEQVLGNKDLFSKVHIKSVPADKAEEFLNGVVEGKVDGASGLFKLKKDSIDVLSYRVGTNGRPIVHTERFFGGKAPTVDIPKKWQNKVLRGEIYGVDKDDQPLSSQEVTPLLNMSLAKSIQNQQDTKTKLRGALFGVAGEDLNTPTRESELKEVLSFLPPQYFDRPPVAHGPEEGMKLWKEIEKGKHPEISEGVVVYPESGDAPLKIKLRPEYDVQVSGVFPGEGKYTGSAGGIEYKVPEGVGRVGTGFDDDFRKWLWENKDSLEGRIARITSTKKLPSGKYFQPSFMGLHEDYPTKKANDTSFLPKTTQPTQPLFPGGQLKYKPTELKFPASAKPTHVQFNNTYTNIKNWFRDPLKQPAYQRSLSYADMGDQLLTRLPVPKDQFLAQQRSNTEKAIQAANRSHSSSPNGGDSYVRNFARNLIRQKSDTETLAKKMNRLSGQMRLNAEGVPQTLWPSDPNKYNIESGLPDFRPSILERINWDQRNTKKPVHFHQGASGYSPNLGIFVNKNNADLFAMAGQMQHYGGYGPRPPLEQSSMDAMFKYHGLPVSKVVPSSGAPVSRRKNVTSLGSALQNYANTNMGLEGVATHELGHNYLSGRDSNEQEKFIDLHGYEATKLRERMQNIQDRLKPEYLQYDGGIGRSKARPGELGNWTGRSTDSLMNRAVKETISPQKDSEGKIHVPTYSSDFQAEKEQGALSALNGMRDVTGQLLNTPQQVEQLFNEVEQNPQILDQMPVERVRYFREYLYKKNEGDVEGANELKNYLMQVSPYLANNTQESLSKVSSEDMSTSFLPDYTPDQLKEMGVYKEVYGTKDAPRLASLPQWPAHWYNEADPHGWLQWYDRYSKGRRIEDDKRQIKRWLAFKARHGGKAFKSNPTPRRAFALRNWGIDPTKLVEDPESLKTVMDEYKQKQYSKKMEKISFLPPKIKKMANDGNSPQANSFLPKTGAIMTPTSRRSADAFYSLADNVSEKKYDPIKGLNTYIQDGSNLMSEKLMGKKMSPTDIIKFVRKSGIASAITGDWDLRKWDPKSQAHYDAFSSGPVSAYSQFLKEKNIDNDSVWRDSSEKLMPNLGDKTAPGFAISKATGRAPWGYAARVKDIASRGADLYEPIGRQTYRDPIKRDMLTGDSIDKVWQTATSLSSPLNPGKTMTDINNELSKYVGTSDHNSIPMEGQARMYPKFDNYLKWRNPNLHSKKQIIDFDNGMIRVPDAVTSYKPLISAVSFLDDTLYPSPQNMIAKQ